MSSTPVHSAESNPAVFRCCEARRASYKAQLADGQKRRYALAAAAGAFVDAMPPLHGIRNIRNFIACVTYGALIGAIDDRMCSRLLYAAQVAHTTRRTRSPKAKAGRPSAKKDHSEAIQAPISAIQEPSHEPAQAA